MRASLNLERITKVKDSGQSPDPITEEGAVTVDAFTVRTASQVLADAAKHPIPNMLFGEFIFAFATQRACGWKGGCQPSVSAPLRYAREHAQRSGREGMQAK